MAGEQSTADRPFFSVCIPQYNRTSFLIEACRSLALQTFKDFEVCISDDRSTDGRERELVEYLQGSGMAFVYRTQEVNGRYDKNLRASIMLSRGHYCFLLGNDDSLAGPDTFRNLFAALQNHKLPDVAITNYEDFKTGRVSRRIARTGLLGCGPWVAAANYRNFSFVSGIVLKGVGARKYATDRWDGNEMYQMYLGCRMIAAGSTLLGVEDVVIRKDIRIAEEAVDSYAARSRIWPCPIIERRHTFDRLGALVIDAIEPYMARNEKARAAESVLRQLLLFTFPFWIFEYRRVQSWKYAVGICLGMRPRYFMSGIDLDWARKLRLMILYVVMVVLGLTVPLTIFDRVFPWLYSLAKSFPVARPAGA